MAEKKAPGVLIYFDMVGCLELLTDEQCGALMKGMLRYAMTGAEPELEGSALAMAWCILKPRVDADRAAYQRKVEKAQAAALARWNAREELPTDADASPGIATYPDEMPEMPTTTTTSTSTPTTTTKTTPSQDAFSNPAREENGTVEKTGGQKNFEEKDVIIFDPPTLEEVEAYVKERQSPVDPKVFVDFYASKGWRVGSTPMVDWRAALRGAESWSRWKKQPTPSPFRPSNAPPSLNFPPITESDIARTRAAIERMRGGGVRGRGWVRLFEQSDRRPHPAHRFARAPLPEGGALAGAFIGTFLSSHLRFPPAPSYEEGAKKVAASPRF